MELFEAIRRDERLEELSIRALADRHGVHRRTVRQALANAVPPERKTPVRAAPKLDPAKALIDAMLTEDLTAPRKQRHTARRVLARLVDEHQLTDLTYSAVRDYVAKRRPEIWAAAGKAVEDAFVPQTHEPGAEAEVDFADLWIDLAGVRTKVFLFTMRLSFSGKAVHRAYSTQGQEAFLEGHQARVRGVRRDPGVPHPLRQPQGRGVAGAVRPDPHRVDPLGHVPLALRLRRVLLPPRRRGRPREGRRRGRGRPVPPQPPRPGPEGRLDGRAQRAARAATTWPTTPAGSGTAPCSVGEHFAFEHALLRPLPAEAFETGLLLTRGSTGTPASPSASATTRSRPG